MLVSLRLHTCLTTTSLFLPRRFNGTTQTRSSQEEGRLSHSWSHRASFIATRCFVGDLCSHLPPHYQCRHRSIRHSWPIRAYNPRVITTLPSAFVTHLQCMRSRSRSACYRRPRQAPSLSNLCRKDRTRTLGQIPR